MQKLQQAHNIKNYSKLISHSNLYRLKQVCFLTKATSVTQDRIQLEHPFRQFGDLIGSHFSDSQHEHSISENRLLNL